MIAALRRLLGRTAPVAETPAEDHLADYADGVTWVRTHIDSALETALGVPVRDPDVVQILVGPAFEAFTDALFALDPAGANLSSASMTAGATDAVEELEKLGRHALELIAEGEIAFVPLIPDMHRRLAKVIETEKTRFGVA